MWIAKTSCKVNHQIYKKLKFEYVSLRNPIWVTPKKMKVLDYEGRKDYDHEELFKNLKIWIYILYFKGLYDQVYLRILLT